MGSYYHVNEETLFTRIKIECGTTVVFQNV